MKLTRRKLFVGGVLGAGAVTVGYWFAHERDRLGDPSLFPAGPGEVALNGWVKVDREGVVTVACPRAEMGQGIHTALAQIVAEELGVAWEKVRAVDAPDHGIFRNVEILIDALPFEPDDRGMLPEAARWMAGKAAGVLGVAATGGSTSVRDGWGPMRLAGAIAYELLRVADWGQQGRAGTPPKRDLATAERELAGGRRAALPIGGLVGRIGALSAEQRSFARGEAEAWIAHWAARSRPHAIVGKSVPRLDIPAKVTGQAMFGADLRLPGMLYAAIRHAPDFGGSARGFSIPSSGYPKGVLKAVDLPGAIAVVADSWWRAERFLDDGLKLHFTPGPHAALSSAELWRRFEALMAEGAPNDVRRRGDVAKRLTGGAKVVEATYRAPYLAHAAMEPMNATARFAEGRLEVWAPNQSPSLIRYAAAQQAGLPQDKVEVRNTFLGGGFGRRAEVDVVREAVALAMAVPGRPIQLIWSREEDMRHDFYRPMALARHRAALDAGGRIAAWDGRVVGQSASDQFTARILGGPQMGNPDVNAVKDPPYAIADYRLESVVPNLPVPVGFWRSVGHSHTGFFAESFMDELAAAAGRDPVEFRRAHLADRPRALAVLDAAARMAGWGTPGPAGTARGVALVPSFGSWVAQVAEVSAEAGRLRVRRVWCAVDCGPVVNPDIVKAQMESGIVFGLSAALFGAITLKEGAVVQGNFPDYEMVRLADSPEIEVRVLPSSSAHIGGVGEPGTPPIAPAVANAVFALQRKRLRDLPLTLA